MAPLNHSPYVELMFLRTERSAARWAFLPFVIAGRWVETRFAWKR